VSGRVAYLLDTSVVSETRRKMADAGVMEFLRAADSSALYLSALTEGELRKCVARKMRQEPEQAKRLAEWVDGLEFSFADRILGIDAATARLWGEWSAARPQPVVDTLLAATAVAHGLTLVPPESARCGGVAGEGGEPVEKDRVASACQSFHHRFWVARNHCQIGSRGAIRTATALFPVLQGARVKGKATGKLSSAETGVGADGAHVHLQGKGKLLRGCRGDFTQRNLRGFAHRPHEFICNVLSLHGFTLLALAAALRLAAKAATSRFCADVRLTCSFLP